MPHTTRTLLITPRFRVEELLRHLPDGQSVQKAVIRHPGAVVILPMVDDDHVCLIRNFRIAVNETLVELPAGTREAGEAPEQTARRELIEETGYEAQRMTLLHSFLVSPGILDERMELYLAQDLAQVGPAREAAEEIENLVLSWQQAMEMVDRREIDDAKTLTGLMLYDRMRQRNG